MRGHEIVRWVIQWETGAVQYGREGGWVTR